MLVSLHQKQKRYLVTGGCGFIGSHLVDALIAEGHAVVILDNLSTGKIENANPKALLRIGDTTDAETVEHAFRNIDGCFHLAAVASVEMSMLKWAHTHDVNVASTINVFNAASKTEKKIPVVYTSSAAVYGDCPTIPISETAETRPLTAYGADKLACDLQGFVAAYVHKVPNIGVRPFNIYGPRQDPASPYSGVISIFADRMQRDVPITIFGDGLQVRDFVFVKDAVQVFKAAMKKLHGETEIVTHDVFNICTGRPTSVLDLADTIANLTLYDTPYNFAAARTGDIRVSIGDPRKLRSELGLSLEIKLVDGLRALLTEHHGVKLNIADLAS